MRSVAELETIRKDILKGLNEHPMLRELFSETFQYLVNDEQRAMVGLRIEKHWDGSFTATLIESSFTYAGPRLRDIIPQVMPGARVFGLQISRTRKEYLRKTTAEFRVTEPEVAVAVA